MSMWKLELDGFPPQWLDVADKFESGQTKLVIRCVDEKAAIAMRFEWYAFKRRLRAAEGDKPADERMYPTLARIKAEVGKLQTGQWAMRLSLRDISVNAHALDDALALSPEELDALDNEFTD